MTIYSLDSGRSIQFELQNNGRVLVLKDALLHPVTNCYHDIQLTRRGWSLLGFDLGGGGKFTGITPDVVREIQKTYGIVLQTFNAKPGEVAFSTDPQKTQFVIEPLSDGSWVQRHFRQRRTSYPLGQNKNDILIAKDLATSLGRDQMTLHDAVAVGIESASISSTSLDPLKKQQKQESLSKEGQSPLESVLEDPTAGAFTQLQCHEFMRKTTSYDSASFEERQRRIIEHLDKSSPIPLSAFVYGNLNQEIDETLFHRLSDAMQRLAINPKANDRDAKYVRKLFEHWFRAAYHYLHKNSEPGDGYLQILDEISEKVSDPKKAEAKAKERYWRHHATMFWMTLIDQFAKDCINIDPLHQMISENTSLSKSLFI